MKGTKASFVGSRPIFTGSPTIVPGGFNLDKTSQNFRVGDVIPAGKLDIYDEQKNDYPVFKKIADCNVPADAIIDFSNVSAVDELLDYCEKTKIPVVLCTTGLSEEQLAKVQQVSNSVAVLKSANMSLGINTLMNLLFHSLQME